jgi:hypothetical protein
MDGIFTAQFSVVHFLSLTEYALGKAEHTGELVEVNCDAEDKISILEAVHDTVKGLHKGGVMDQVTLREFDRLCLPPVESLKPERIKQIRERSRVSQGSSPHC